MAFGNYGFDERPLLIGEVHGVDEVLSANCANFKYIFITSFLQPLIFEIMALSELKKNVLRFLVNLFLVP